MDIDINTLTKKQAIDCFNELLLDFLSACEPLFKDKIMKQDIIFCKTALKNLYHVNITVTIEQYLLHVYLPYSDYINNNDIDGLLNLDYTIPAADMDVDMAKILNVKHLLKNMSKENRITILEYLKLLNTLSQRYYQIK